MSWANFREEITFDDCLDEFEQRSYDLYLILAYQLYNQICSTQLINLPEIIQNTRSVLYHQQISPEYIEDVFDGKIISPRRLDFIILRALYFELNRLRNGSSILLNESTVFDRFFKLSFKQFSSIATKDLMLKLKSKVIELLSLSTDKPDIRNTYVRKFIYTDGYVPSVPYLKYKCYLLYLCL